MITIICVLSEHTVYYYFRLVAMAHYVFSFVWHFLIESTFTFFRPTC